MPLPRHRSFRLGVPSARLTDALTWHGPDMLHLASPFRVGARATALARQYRLPSVAVYQTEVRRLPAPRPRTWLAQATALEMASHDAAMAPIRTLAPSTTAAADLNARGVLTSESDDERRVAIKHSAMREQPQNPANLRM